MFVVVWLTTPRTWLMWPLKLRRCTCIHAAPSSAKEAIARARSTPARAIQLAGAGRGLGNKRPSAARTSSKQQQQAIKQDSSSTPTPHSRLPLIPVLYDGRVMFLALAIAVVLCGAESSLAPSRERAARLNKREQRKFIEEGPGAWLRK